MTVSQLSLYNGALTLLGERNLASITENREPRRLLDNAWDGGAVRFCLEHGLWNFAFRTIEITYDPDVTPQFGYRFAFTKPTDWVRTARLSADERLELPLLDYRDEGAYWFADFETLYVTHVSDDGEYGRDFSLWPQSFVKYVEAYLALQVAPVLTSGETKVEKLTKTVKTRLIDARSKDAMNEPTRFPPQGSWVNARRGGYRRDRARGSLT